MVDESRGQRSRGAATAAACVLVVVVLASLHGGAEPYHPGLADAGGSARCAGLLYPAAGREWAVSDATPGCPQPQPRRPVPADSTHPDERVPHPDDDRSTGIE